MTTIKEVAERAGVSAATVSYVINDTRKVSPNTERRVRAAARELGYTPNSAARSLVAGRSCFMGLVVADICNPFFPEITRSFQEAVHLAGMEVIVMNTSVDLQMIRGLIDRLIGLQVAGVAFMTSCVDPSAKAAIAKREIPAVYLDFGAPGRLIATLEIDYRKGMLEAMNHLVQLGHRRIGLVGGPANGVASLKRKTAFLEGAADAGVESRIIDSDFTVQGGYFSCSRMLGTSNVTAVIAANDLMAIGAMHSAFDRHLRIPEDLSVIGFDDIDFAQYTQPALTTVAVPRPEIGKLTYRSLAELIADPGKEGKTCQVSTSLVVRQTTAPPR